MSIDADDSFAEEIVEIFVEEVGEVLEQIDENFPIWECNPSNDIALKEVRRAFHTLKGSGRMVQAEEIGELSWAIENMLNRVIDKTLKKNDAIYELVREARHIIPAMLVAFKNKQAAALAGVNFTRMIDQANAIVEGKKVAFIATYVAPKSESKVLERHQSEAFTSMLSTVDMADITSLKERISELAATLDDIKRSHLSLTYQLDSVRTVINTAPKVVVDPVAIKKQLEIADKEIHELKYFMKASSEQMMAEVNKAQKRLTAKVAMELNIVSDLSKQMTEDIARATAELRTDLIRQIQIWSLGCALSFSIIALFISLYAT